MLIGPIVWPQSMLIGPIVGNVYFNSSFRSSLTLFLRTKYIKVFLCLSPIIKDDPSRSYHNIVHMIAPLELPLKQL